MKNGARIAIVVVLAVAVAATLALREGGREGAGAAPGLPAAGIPVAATQAPVPPAAPARENPAPAVREQLPAPGPVAAGATPRLLEIGSSRCMSCLEMAKVLDALRASQGAKLKIDFIDVFENPDAADRYKIELIPTQILFDGAGRELFRHQGYFSHDDILAKFRALGVQL